MDMDEIIYLQDRSLRGQDQPNLCVRYCRITRLHGQLWVRTVTFCVSKYDNQSFCCPKDDLVSSTDWPEDKAKQTTDKKHW